MFPIKTIFQYYWESLRVHKSKVILIFLAYGFGTVLYSIVQPIIFRKIIDGISSTSLPKEMIATDVWHWFVLLIIIAVIRDVLYRVGDFMISFVESHTMKHLIDRAFVDLQRQGYHFFSDSFSGSLVAKSKRFVGSFERLFDIFLFSFWMTSVQVIGILITLYILAPSIALPFLLFVMGYVWFSWSIMRKKTVYDENSAKEDSHMTARLSDVLGNVMTVKTFAAESNEKTAFAEASTVLEQTRRKAWNFQNIIFLGQSALLDGLSLTVIGISLYLWFDGKISLGTVVLAQWYMSSIFSSMFGLNRSFGQFVQGLAEASEMIEIFETPSEITNRPVTKSLTLPVQGVVALDDVTFKYADGSAVFEHFSMTFKAGEKVGIVGSSGAGKSTLTKLLLRFLDPSAGKVTLDGVDIRDLEQEEVRRVIAYVSQESVLFHRSLRENIAYGKQDATEEEIIAAAKKAHAHEFISQLEKGYDTLVGERGLKLSGGERQRVALARAILKDAPILMLDEATSALDTISETLIQSALNKLMKNKTVMVIAHRLSTVRKMDRIIVLEGGIIAEEGTHDALLLADGVYANLWKHQTDGFIE